MIGRGQNKSAAGTLAPAAIAAALALAAPAAVAAVVPLKPSGGAVVEMLPECQRLTLAGGDGGERLRIAAQVATNMTDNAWRKAAPLVLEWKTTAGEKGPWRIRLAKNPDFTGARDLWLECEDAAKCGGAAPGEEIWRFTVPMANLEPDTEYFWQVWSRIKCKSYTCGFTYPDKCKCGRTKRGEISGTASFRTASSVPRWIELEGKVKNVRDLGGWCAQGGCRVRTGLVFRGEGLNENSLAGVEPGRNRLMVADVQYLTGTLGIRTELDLRTLRETAAQKVSPLGPNVRYVNNDSPQYADISSKRGKAAMAANFRLFCERANYPIYFHCIAGADRTGSLAYVLNGVLGVAKDDLERDYESTFYPVIPGLSVAKGSRGTALFDKVFAQYGTEGDSLMRRIELYLIDCGVTEEDIAAFRAIMLEKQGKKQEDANGAK